MSDDFSDFNIDDISFGESADDAPDMLVGGAVGEEPSKKKKKEAPAADAVAGELPDLDAMADAIAAGKKEDGEKEAEEAKISVKGDKPEKKAKKKKAPRPALNAKIVVRLVIILALLFFNGVQLIGLAYRDTMEQRRPSTTPGEVFAGIEEALAQRGLAPPRDLGFDVNQVDIGGAPAPKATAEPSTSEAPAKHDAETAPVEAAKQAKEKSSAPPKEVAKTAPSKPEQPAKVSAQPAKKPSTQDGASHAVAVGIFRSQRHLNAMKARLDKLSLPYFTSELSKKGEGFALVTSSLSGKKREETATLLGSEGYISREEGKRVAAYFHYEDEAVKALALTSSIGVSGKVNKVSGEVPAWKLMVGPSSKAKAKATAKRLTKAKIDNFVLRVKK